MIPYDDLVAALQQWRARQGLPVSTMGGGGTAAAPQAGSGPHAQPGSGPYGQSGSGPYGQPGSGPYGQPGSGPNRSGPPPMRGKQPSVPPPLMEEMAVDDAEMLEEHYEPEGSDYEVGFSTETPAGEATALGDAPERPTDPNDYNGGRGGRDDW